MVLKKIRRTQPEKVVHRVCSLFMPNTDFKTNKVVIKKAKANFNVVEDSYFKIFKSWYGCETIRSFLTSFLLTSSKLLLFTI